MTQCNTQEEKFDLEWDQHNFKQKIPRDEKNTGHFRLEVVTKNYQVFSTMMGVKINTKAKKKVCYHTPHLIPDGNSDNNTTME